jgi:hypothetical protein
MELAEILGGAPAPVETPSTVEAEAPQAEAPTTTVEQQGTPRDERGRWVKEAEPAPAPVAPVEEPQHTVPIAALVAERRQRQELQARLAALEQQKPQIKDDDFWQAPAEAATKLVEHSRAETQQEIARMRYEFAEEMTRTVHPDYDAVRDSFLQKVEARDPWAIAIAQQMPQQSNPAKFVYDQSKRLDAMSSLGDPATYRARIEAEVRAQILKEMGQTKQPAPVVPRSLNSEPSASIPSSGEAYAPTPLENLLERNF